MKECGICLFKIGWIDREIADRFNVDRKTATRWRWSSGIEQPKLVSDRRLFCVRCLFRLGIGAKRAMNITGLAKTTVSRFVREQGLSDPITAKKKVQLDIDRRKASATSWMEDAWAAEWRGVNYIGELKHWAEHPALPSKQMQSYYLRHEENKERTRKRAMQRYYQTPRGHPYHIKRSLRSRVYNAIKRNLRSGFAGRKHCDTMALIGCSVSSLMQRLESRFQLGMAWSNYGMWHIDHIVPCASFDLSKADEQRRCFHYTNLQPLWASDNIRKSDAISPRATSILRLATPAGA